MFNDNQAIKRIMKDLDDLIAYCIDCKNLTSDDNARDLYYDTKEQLEGVLHDVATSAWDEEEEDDENDNEPEYE